MIAYLEGQIITRSEKFIVIATGGIGYKVFVSPDTLSSLAGLDTARLFTHLVVKEDILDLYGFNTPDELKMFEILIGISGVGPRTALGILSVAPPQTLRAAISSGDTSYLTKVSGIGKKNAEKIVIELKDKFDGAEEYTDGGQTLQEDADVIEALTALGYSVVSAREALKAIPPEVTGTNARIKEALRNIANG